MQQLPQVPQWILDAPQDQEIQMPDVQPRQVRVPMEPQYQKPHVPKPQVPYSGIRDILQPGEPIDVKFDGKIPGYDQERIPEIDIPEEYQDKPNTSLFGNLTEISVRRRHLPKQQDIDKYLERLKRKVIHGYQLPISLKELIAAYPKDPKFKDIYTYITRGYCMYKGHAQRTFKAESQDYIVFQGALFRIKPARHEGLDPTLQLCIPRVYVPVLLYQYHDMILSGHHGVVKTLETIQQKYYFESMVMYIRKYIQGCHECEARKAPKELPKAIYPRIPLDYKPMSRISLDCKEMPQSRLGYKHILLCTCEVSNWVVGIPIQDVTSTTLFEAIFYKIICFFGSPKVIITDEASGLTSKLMTELYQALQIKAIIISPMHHGSNRTERYIRTINDRIVGYLRGTGDQWPLFVYPCTYAMNTFVSAVTGYSPYEMVFFTTPPDITSFDLHPDLDDLSVPARTYMNLMSQRRDMMIQMFKEDKIQQQLLQVEQEKRKHPSYTGYEKGDLVYFKYQYGSDLQAPSKKLVSPWIGPVKIQSVLDQTHYLVSDWEGKCLPVEIEAHRLKPYTMNIYENGEIMSLSNIYKHLEVMKAQQEARRSKDHYTAGRQITQSTQTPGV